jgi:hypothetical protein
MSLNSDGREEILLPGDPLEYPYDNAGSVYPHSYTDLFNREPHRLLKSLVHYGSITLQRQPTLPEGVEVIYPTLIRFSDDALTPEEFPTLFRIFPPEPNKLRTILPSQILDGSQEELMNMLPDLHVHNQVVIPHHVGQNCWIIFLTLIPQHTIDLYTIGDVTHGQMDPLVNKIIPAFGEVLPDIRFTIRLRLQVPNSLKLDPVLLSFTLSHSLHRHDGYLDLTCDSILRQKCTLLAPLIRAHDRWFGQLQLQNATNASHPFIVYGANSNDKLAALNKAGWSVIDVRGDGNCGYYALIIGLENHGNFSYSIRNRNTSYQPMSTNSPWQKKILQLRRCMKQQSELLLRREYPPENRSQDFWQYTTVYGGTAEEFDNLSNAFASDDLDDVAYFDGSFGISLQDCSQEAGELREFYFMDPTWAPHVFSFVFNLRVIVYSRQSTCTKANKLGTTWSTTIFYFNNPVNERVMQYPFLHRITDTEFKQIATVELLFTFGVSKNQHKIPGHFQYLRRVLFANIPSTPAPPTKSLRQYLSQLVTKSKRKARKRVLTEQGSPDLELRKARLGDQPTASPDNEPSNQPKRQSSYFFRSSLSSFLVHNDSFQRS